MQIGLSHKVLGSRDIWPNDELVSRMQPHWPLRLGKYYSMPYPSEVAQVLVLRLPSKGATL